MSYFLSTLIFERGSQVCGRSWPVLGWSHPQALSHCCFSSSFRRNRSWVEGLVVGVHEPIRIQNNLGSTQICLFKLPYITGVRAAQIVLTGAYFLCFLELQVKWIQLVGSAKLAGLEVPRESSWLAILAQRLKVLAFLPSL